MEMTLRHLRKDGCSAYVKADRVRLMIAKGWQPVDCPLVKTAVVYLATTAGYERCMR